MPCPLAPAGLVAPNCLSTFGPAMGRGLGCLQAQVRPQAGCFHLARCFEGSGSPRPSRVDVHRGLGWGPFTLGGTRGYRVTVGAAFPEECVGGKRVQGGGEKGPSPLPAAP